MNIHKNARLTFVRRLDMVREMLLSGLTPVSSSGRHGVSAPTARKWLGRFLAEGEAGLFDRSSRPALVRVRSHPPRRWLSSSCAVAG